MWNNLTKQQNSRQKSKIFSLLLAERKSLIETLRHRFLEQLRFFAVDNNAGEITDYQ